MLNKSVILSATLLTAFLAVNAQASQNQKLVFEKPIPASVKITKHTVGLAANATKKVYLMNVKLTQAQKDMLARDITAPVSESLTADKSKLPSKAELSMNGTPVLDQGQHGSCVTFATTAAVDALIGQGDYVSQLCNLELGATLEKQGYIPSGWDGTLGSLILSQIQTFGIMSKDSQRAKTCGGLTEYPLDDPTTIGEPMSLDDFSASSENVNLWSHPILTVFKRFEMANQSFDGEKTLEKVKEAIAGKQDGSDGVYYRVTFGTYIPVDYCDVGACGKYHQTNDSWVLTKEIAKDKYPDLGGHEMVIVGYDDKAVAVDNDGKSHKGLLTLRNSWGEDVGDNGNYYMSYDFFTKFVMEANLVITASDSLKK